MGFGPAAVLGVKFGPAAIARPIALVGDGGFSANPSVVATAMEADLPVVWLVMDNAAFGTIAGLEAMHYGSSFGCLFECGGQPYRVDYAAMARAFGARRRAHHRPPTNSGRRCGRRSPRIVRRSSRCRWRTRRRRRPGHWDINDIYRNGR